MEPRLLNKNSSNIHLIQQSLALSTGPFTIILMILRLSLSVSESFIQKKRGICCSFSQNFQKQNFGYS